MSNKKTCNWFATLVQNKLNSDVAYFTTHEKNLATLFVTRQVRTCFAPMFQNKLLVFRCCPFYCSIVSKEKKLAAHFLCAFFLPLFCTTATWNFLVTRFVEEMSYVFLFDFFFFLACLPLIFTWVAASISHFLTATTKIFVCLLVFYLSL